ncbi:MAG: 1-(5-phosphoribosyl)-5-amino-4-imidazole-carboxylate carboxylase, partial [Chloroflexi bacterium]
MSQLLHRLNALLQSVRDGTTSVEEALERLKHLPYEDLGFAHLDHHRALRQGFPEIVMAQWKTTEQVVQIVQRMAERHSPILVTRSGPEVYEALRAVVEEAVYHPLPRLIVVDRE